MKLVKVTGREERTQVDLIDRGSEFFTPEEVHCEVGIARARARARTLLPPGPLRDRILADLATWSTTPEVV